MSARFALKPGGLIEHAQPILSDTEEEKERLHSNNEQQMIVRTHSLYRTCL